MIVSVGVTAGYFFQKTLGANPLYYCEAPRIESHANNPSGHQYEERQSDTGENSLDITVRPIK
jgi:hypothetical protein